MLGGGLRFRIFSPQHPQLEATSSLAEQGNSRLGEHHTGERGTGRSCSQCQQEHRHEQYTDNRDHRLSVLR